MLDIEYIRNHADAVKDAIRRKRFDLDLDQLLTVDGGRRAAIQEIDAARQRRNELSSLIPKLPGAETFRRSRLANSSEFPKSPSIKCSSGRASNDRGNHNGYIPCRPR